MLRVVIVGAGLGGLTCAVACCQQGLEVVILEKASQITAVGAGINIPPNAGNVMKRLGLFDRVLQESVIVEKLKLRRYENGKELLSRPAGSVMTEQYGAPWIVIHREDYHRVIMDSALEHGAELRLGANVTHVDFDKTEVTLESGEVVKGDVFIGSDGLWSHMRDQILGHSSPPLETGDLAYRVVFPTSTLREMKDPKIDEIIDDKVMTLWLGPDRHCVVYPVRKGEELNMVLLRPDNLPPGANKIEGDLGEMRLTFEGWDDTLTNLVSRIPHVLKWKLCHHEELESWCRGNIAILGDACHPTLPYQAQGAAMAVEDGAVIGHILGRLSKEYPHETVLATIPAALKFYERIRKPRTTLNVKGAVGNRVMYHLRDGPKQQERDADFAEVDWIRPCKWKYADPEYQKAMLGKEDVFSYEQEFEQWRKKMDWQMNGHVGRL